MKVLEASDIVILFNRAGLLWAMEGQAEVWADALDDIDGGTAKEAAREIIRDRTSDQRAITPGDLRKHVSIIRTRRLQGAITAQAPDELADRPQDFKRWIRLRNWQIGNGRTEVEAQAYADHQFGITRTPPTGVTEGISRPANCGHLVKGIPA